MSKKGPEYYLLNGWTMLAEGCPQCMQPLYHDKHRTGKVVCAGCEAELIVAGQASEVESTQTKSLTQSKPAQTGYKPEVYSPTFSQSPSTPKAPHQHIHDPNGAIAGTIEAVLGKLEMVQQRLKLCSLADLEEQKNLCKLIKMYTETLKALKKVQ
eukprot:TRINITY_DN17417_c0_g1_i1.p1 TRINITY_DN17417_c0_g1~~TRINITY_DN17417_c0_g1_i1.p1  ORF type:complete len:155 (+),score=42.01 TRINITY_DN17417_c0_g1_i1:267-731(+)